VIGVFLQTGARGSELPAGYGTSLLQSLLALAAVCILAWIVIRWASGRRLLGLAAGGQGRLRVLERLPLDPRRSLYLVQVGEKVLLIGAGEGGAPAVLAELDAKELPPEPAAPRVAFADVLRRLTGRDPPPPT
jgi:flagellar biosynthetic protein FliO